MEKRVASYEKRLVGDGHRREGGAEEFVLRESFEGDARFEDGRDSFFAGEVDFSIGKNRAGCVVARQPFLPVWLACFE